MLRGIDRIVLRVANVAAAVKFYRDTMGLRLLREEPRLATLAMEDDSELVLHCDDDLPEDATFLLVDDLRAMYELRHELKLTFLSPPVRVTRGFRADVRDPFGTILHLLDRSSDDAGSHAEDASAPTGLFGPVDDRAAPKRELLIELYVKLNRTADDLPYTPHFESLYEPYIVGYSDPKPTRAEVWRHLLNIRKGGSLPKLGEARSPAPTISPDDLQRLKDLLGTDIGRRDRLPYTKQFEELVDHFNQTLQRPLSPHLVWRLVATLSK